VGRRLVASAATVTVVGGVAVSCSGSSFGELPDPRKATDCVAFTKQAQDDAGIEPGKVLAPGTLASPPLIAYWFGPELGERRAVVAGEWQVNLSNTEDEMPVPLYATFYQLPQDGCQSGMLPGYDPAPDYWGRGRSVEVQNEPLGTPLVQRTINEVFRGRDGKPRVELATGQTAIFLGSTSAETAAIVGRTFVMVTGLPPDRVRAFLPELRPIER
jgi:hypothetical protein